VIKQIFLDTETTSVDRKHCGLWQIGGIIRAGKRQDEFLFECDIFSEDDIDKKAMEMHGLTVEKLAQNPDPLDVIVKFQELLAKRVDKYDRFDKYYFINFGAEFDSEVLRSWFYKCGDDYYGSWFWHPPIDVMVLACQDLIGKRNELRDFKLETVCKYYGIDFDSSAAHNALYDARKAMELYDAIGKSLSKTC
jgi:DNA polymerase-3 subunit epsilon